jgi:gluconate kinase
MTTTALFLNGTVGVGKSTVADALGAALRAERIPHAVIDLDELRRGWPSPPGDRFNTTIELANLRSVAANYIAAGAQMLVLAGVLETTAMVERYREALGASVSLTVVRLTLEPAEAERRLRRRHENDPDGLAWHLNRFAELDGIIDSARFSGASFDTTVNSPSLMAQLILAAARPEG